MDDKCCSKYNQMEVQQATEENSTIRMLNGKMQSKNEREKFMKYALD